MSIINGNTTVTNNVNYVTASNSGSVMIGIDPATSWNHPTLQETFDDLLGSLAGAVRAWDLKGCDCEMSDCEACALMEDVRDTLEGMQ